MSAEDQIESVAAAALCKICIPANGLRGNVDVGINGETFSLPRDKNIEVSQDVYDVLVNSDVPFEDVESIPELTLDLLPEPDVTGDPVDTQLTEGDTPAPTEVETPAEEVQLDLTSAPDPSTIL